MSLDWIEDCLKWRGRVLTGTFAHWCSDWDDLPIDETTPEWPCGCYPEVEETDDDAIARMAGEGGPC